MPIGTHAYDVAFADGAAWVTNHSDETLTRIDAATNRPTTIALPNTVNPDGIAFSGGYLWVCGDANDIVLKVSPTTGTVLATVRLPGAATWTGTDGHTVWVSDSSDGKVFRLQTPSGRLLGTSTIGSAPADGDVLAGTYWVGDQLDGALYGVDGAGRVRGPWKTGTANAFVLCVYQGQLWVGDFKGTDVVRIDPTRLT